MIFHEGDPGGEIVEEPAEAAIIEIDQPRGPAIDQQICEPHVGMDQTIAVRGLPEPGQTRGDDVFHAFQDRRDLRSDIRSVTPISPSRRGAEDSVEIPGQPFERGRPLPGYRVQMGSGGNFAKFLKRRNQILILIRLGSFDEMKQDHEPGGRQSCDRCLLYRLAVAAEIITGRYHASVPAQGGRPGKFTFYRAFGVIILTVNPQHGLVSVRFNKIGGVFGNVDQARPGRLRDIPEMQGIVCKNFEVAKHLLKRHVARGHGAYSP